MSEPGLTVVHLSDLHFGGYADLAQIEALETLLPTLGASAMVVSGDLSQRARHGEFQAAHAFLQRLQQSAPVLVIPGNHDIAWWRSPLGLFGERIKYAKYARYFGSLTPVLELPGVVIAGALSAYGVAPGSLTWNPRDIAVKGHLPASETTRVAEVFRRAPAGAVRVLTVHHNVLRGGISHRQGLAHWRRVWPRLLATGADVVLCGHDHHEGAGQIEGTLAVSTSGTHSFRTRAGRPSVFNLVTVDEHAVHIRHYRWESAGRRFLPSDTSSFARRTPEQVTVSVAGEGES